MDKIRILHIDDSLHDHILVKDALEKENDAFEVFGVDTREKFEEHLSKGDFDLVLSDFNILGFNGLKVLQLVKNKNPEIPVIIVTGTGSEEIAIEAMKLGASDYVIKSASHIRGIAHTITMVLKAKNALDEQKKAIAAQMESEDLYRSIFNNTSVAILLAHPNGKVLSANGFACQLFQMTEEELCKSGYVELIDETDARFQLFKEQRLINGKAKGELTFLKKGGIKFQVELFYALFKNRNGEDRVSMLIRDLTEQKSAEKKLQLLSMAVEQSPTSIVITDSEGLIEFINAKFSFDMGYSLDELIGKKPRIFKIGHAPNEVYDTMLETIRMGKVWYGEFENRNKNGEGFWEEVIISPLLRNDGTISNYIILMDNITEKKKMLQDIIVAKERAEESDRLKTAFLHNISHEIRTPMNAIIGFTGFLSQEELLPEKRKLFTNVVIQSSEQLLSIITDIIKIATIEAGQEHLYENEVDLNSLFRLLYDQFVLKFKKKEVTLDFEILLSEEEAIIKADSTKLTEILSNLIGNAVKFTEHGRIVFGCKLKDDFLEFYVKDSGLGIPPEMHEEIFKRFRQVEFTANRKFGGSGLGLSICKSYVELMGGKIWLTSEPIKGSEFYFTIPYKKKIKSGNFNTYDEKEINMEHDGIKTIMIAEDEDTNFLLLVAYLSDMKLNIIRAENGIEAVTKCHANSTIDLVLMDIKMPEIDGYEATKRIKEFAPDLPIIAQTAYTTDEEKKKAFQSGCSDFLSKPIVKNELISKIRMQLNL